MKHLHFFSSNIEQLSILPESYNYYLVLLSYIAASLAGFCASSVYQYISLRPNTTKTKLLTIYSGITLGLGIWSMHFIGMLAFELPVPVQYEVITTIVSIVPAIIASIITLFAIQPKKTNKLTLFLAGGLLAIGIATMHFIGMEAMVMDAHMTHHPVYFVLAILCSWLLAFLTLLAIKNQLPLGDVTLNPMLYSILASLSFGFSVATMHYLAMFSTSFIEVKLGSELVGVSIDLLAVAALIGVLILVVGLATILTFKRKIYILDSLALAHQTYMAETVDNMTDPFVLTEQNGKVLLLNHSFLASFSGIGFAVNENLTLSDIIDCFVERYVANDETQDKQSLKTNIEKLEPCRFKSVDSQWWMLRQSLTNSNNRILTWTNITQQTNQQEELIKAKDEAFGALQQLQSTQSELSEARRLNALAKLVSNVAHELNTPLGVAITSLSGLQGNVREIETLIKTQKLSKSALYALLSGIMDYEDLASRNMNRAASIIQQFKYISVEEYTEEVSRINLNGLVSNVFNQVKDELEKTQVNIDIAIPNNITVSSYEDALNEVLKTLVKNSLQHAFVGCETCKLGVRVNQEKEQTQIIIEDSGAGIDESVIDQLFEPFVSTKRFEGSMGLGLHIIYNIVNYKLKGQVDYDANFTDGTRFVVSLPNKI